MSYDFPYKFQFVFKFQIAPGGPGLPEQVSFIYLTANLPGAFCFLRRMYA